MVLFSSLKKIDIQNEHLYYSGGDGGQNSE